MRHVDWPAFEGASLGRGRKSARPARALVLDLDGDQDVPERRAAKCLVEPCPISRDFIVVSVYSMRPGNTLHAFRVSSRLYYSAESVRCVFFFESVVRVCVVSKCREFTPNHRRR